MTTDIFSKIAEDPEFLEIFSKIAEDPEFLEKGTRKERDAKKLEAFHQLLQETVDNEFCEGDVLMVLDFVRQHGIAVRHAVDRVMKDSDYYPDLRTIVYIKTSRGE